ncbi:LOW QUALITY PROTEIN: receptor-type tyrosine-protein phosphatase eta [Sorex araneus]|uniref:LOW QUALITY PROTEIN: receptor-type tyrosine-protein phosphatase eta n=1 Tax=Sorex araneus TaxID=42254 RepID=UPI0024336441|nr:LOW QUALITY PROTEIN: receptor-type tyrosine-protein phosphatase eta [Sorex araneus]
MSPGTPGAGGAGTRRTGWSRRRRRRRRRPDAASGAPRLGRSAGPDWRVPAAVQGARGMKRAAREARPPPRSPGLCWALPSLLLLLRLGQVACAGDCCEQVTYTSTSKEIHFSGVLGNLSLRDGSDQVIEPQPLAGDAPAGKISFVGLTPGTRYQAVLNSSESCCQVQTKPSPVESIDVVLLTPTSVNLTWQNTDAAASNYSYRVQIKSEADAEWEERVSNQTWMVIMNLLPATSYTFSIFPELDHDTQGESRVHNVTTMPSPVSDLRSESLGNTDALVTWRNENDTNTCRMLLETGGITQNLCPDVPDNPSHLEPGKKYCFAVCLPDSNSTLCARRDPDAATSAHAARLDPRSRDISVQLLGLSPGTKYKVTVYSQAANGTEGSPRSIGFTTKSGQVFNLTEVDVQATNLTLTWELRHNASSSTYSYQILVVSPTGNRSFTTNETLTVITGLQSCTFYNITVRPVSDGNIQGVPDSLGLNTRLLPVSDFRVVSVNTTEIGLAWNGTNSTQFKIVVLRERSIIQERNTSQSTIIISDLMPGCQYSFEITPQGSSGTGPCFPEGKPETINQTTEYAAVSDIQVTNFTATTMSLSWKSNDHASGYTYFLLIRWDSSSMDSIDRNTSARTFFLDDLIPGTLYNITIYPEFKHVRGNASSINHYTRPSQVSDIEVSTNTTEAALAWQNPDAAATTYSYSVVLEKDGLAVTQETGIGVTQVTLSGLVPGSGYTVRIFTQVNWTIESEQPGTLSFCTDPAPVTLFFCEPVPQMPTLVLKWDCPNGTSEGFELEVSSGAWSNVTTLDGCTSGNNNTEPRVDVAHLNFSTSYNISVTTLSCNKSAPPAQRGCLTGITDPPRPKISPNITAVSHNSLKVKFSGFEASHGPIQAYALVLTTGGVENASAYDLKYTYEDFKKGNSEAYVTYLLTVEEKRRSPGLPEASKYEVDVGNESMTRGYYNGKLEPLGSYRACVAGFTNITFKSHNRLINGPESYVSFSPCSEAVFLPQDPGVICGAVFGCIFGALVIVAVGGFIFWRKKRKDAKNNEVSFSQIKPKKSKVIRVENFEAYFKKQQADSNCGFAEEYEDLKLIGISQPKYAAELAENRGKNRYNNVLPYDFSRVKLSIQTHSTDDYINANYMPGYHSKRDFIATQGPLPNTLKDFWRMVWEKNIYAIIMLTKCVEQGRTKCEEYWPSKKAQEYGDITVANTAEIVLPEWTIRDFTVKNSQTSESHPLRQFHFTSWPDHGVPDTTELLINFRFLVRDYMKQIPPESPVLVHCSAGVGRTGTFIAIDRLIYQIENENTVDVYGIVYDLRMHRPLMVQTEDQYVFLNQCVLDIIRSQKDSKVDLIYQNTTAMTIYENLAPGTTFGKTNGYIA